MIKVLLVMAALWLTLEVGTSKLSMEVPSTCGEVAWCMGNNK